MEWREKMDFEALRVMRNEHNPFAQFLGIVVTEIREGYAVSEMTVKPEYTNPVGSSHGGILFTLADVAAGAAAASYGNYAVTVSSEYHYLKSAAEGHTIEAIAGTVKSGKSIIVLNVDVVDKEEKQQLGTACITYFRLDKEIKC